jgi:hypothetical protein
MIELIKSTGDARIDKALVESHVSREVANSHFSTVSTYDVKCTYPRLYELAAAAASTEEDRDVVEAFKRQLDIWTLIVEYRERFGALYRESGNAVS